MNNDLKPAYDALKMFRVYNFVNRLVFLFPVLVIPSVAYLFNNWWFLLGILFYFIGWFLAFANSKFLYLIFIVAGYFIYKNGFDLKENLTFFLCCFFLGYMFNLIALEYKKQEQLLKSKVTQEMWESALENEKNHSNN